LIHSGAEKLTVNLKEQPIDALRRMWMMGRKEEKKKKERKEGRTVFVGSNFARTKLVLFTYLWLLSIK
jgi:hypothetical protein